MIELNFSWLTAVKWTSGLLLVVLSFAYMKTGLWVVETKQNLVFFVSVFTLVKDVDVGK